MVTLSRRVKTIGFNDQLSAIGGALGLFCGVSILSIVEVFCCIAKFAKHGAEKLIKSQ